MFKIEREPISVNNCWQGRRFKTDDYKKFESDVLFLLPKITLPPAPYSIQLEFGMSNMASDIDNPVKPFLDCLQKKYGFNDKQIMKAVITKKVVPKGSEYIKFNIETIYCECKFPILRGFGPIYCAICSFEIIDF